MYIYSVCIMRSNYIPMTISRNIYPLDVYVDPNARDVYFNDAAHILIARLMTDEQAKKEW